MKNFSIVSIFITAALFSCQNGEQHVENTSDVNRLYSPQYSWEYDPWYQDEPRVTKCTFRPPSTSEIYNQAAAKVMFELRDGAAAYIFKDAQDNYAYKVKFVEQVLITGDSAHCINFYENDKPWKICIDTQWKDNSSSNKKFFWITGMHNIENPRNWKEAPGEHLSCY